MVPPAGAQLNVRLSFSDADADGARSPLLAFQNLGQLRTSHLMRPLSCARESPNHDLASSMNWGALRSTSNNRARISHDGGLTDFTRRGSPKMWQSPAPRGKAVAGSARKMAFLPLATMT